MKIGIDNGGNWTAEYYEATVVSVVDYYPFGSAMAGRKFSSGAYRYGFNGMEKDDEVKGEGNSYTTHYRLYDSRTGRWFSPDPIVLPYESPYAANMNNPNFYNDPDGDCPFCWGALAGGLIELGGQMAVGYLQTGSLKEAAKQVDWFDVGVATVEGALTSGASAQKALTKKIVRVSAALVSETVKASANASSANGWETVGNGKISRATVGRDIIVGVTVGEVTRFKSNRAAGQMGKHNVSTYQEAQKAADKAFNQAKSKSKYNTTRQEAKRTALKDKADDLNSIGGTIDETVEQLTEDLGKTATRVVEEGVNLGVDIINKSYEQIIKDKIPTEPVNTTISYSPGKSYTVKKTRGDEVLSEKVYRKNNETGEYILK
jgi:RHS repeat-associated protein